MGGAPPISRPREEIGVNLICPGKKDQEPDNTPKAKRQPACINTRIKIILHKRNQITKGGICMKKGI